MQRVISFRSCFPLREHQGSSEINKVAATTVPSLKDAGLTRALLKRSQPHSRLLSPKEGGLNVKRELVE